MTLFLLLIMPQN